jgi:hypothetical protein
MRLFSRLTVPFQSVSATQIRCLFSEDITAFAGGLCRPPEFNVALQDAWVPVCVALAVRL